MIGEDASHHRQCIYIAVLYGRGHDVKVLLGLVWPRLVWPRMDPFGLTWPRLASLGPVRPPLAPDLFVRG